MSAQEALTPRVILVRHGETEWAKLGRYTGITDIDLTEAGAQQVSSVAAKVAGSGKLLDPDLLVHTFVSPRKRAVKTFQLLLPSPPEEQKITFTEGIAEWNYGDYEGRTAEEIRNLRRERGLDSKRKWDIWSDGCEGGESPQKVAERLDCLISQIKEIQRPFMNENKPTNSDILIVAHGLILRCFIKRWLGLSLDFPLNMIFAPGAIAVLSYKNRNIDEPALHAGTDLS